MSSNRQIKIIQRKKKRRKRIVIWVLTPLLVLLIAAGTYGAFLYQKAQSVVNDSYQPLDRDSTKRTSTVDPDLHNTSILFIGVDESETRGTNINGRSDALMIATFNKNAKSVKLLSIPRDAYVYIPEVGYKDKITHAHANGGPKTTIETVEELLDIPIDYYVKLNFNAFIDMVDALGGIEVEVPYSFTEQDSNDIADAISLEEGLQELDGEEALALARTRKLDSDIERGKRQQEILKAIFAKTVSVGSISKYSDLIEAVGNNMTTDLSFNDMKSFLNYATAGTSMEIETLTIEGEDLWLAKKNGRVYYYQLNEDSLETVKSNLKIHLGLSSDNVETANISESSEEE